MALPQQIIPATGLAPGFNIAINDIVIPNSNYVTGGIFFSAAALGLSTVKAAFSMDESTDGSVFARILSIPGQGANKFKVQFFSVSLGTEIPANNANAGKIIRVMGLGM